MKRYSCFPNKKQTNARPGTGVTPEPKIQLPPVNEDVKSALKTFCLRNSLQSQYTSLIKNINKNQQEETSFSKLSPDLKIPKLNVLNHKKCKDQKAQEMEECTFRPQINEKRTRTQPSVFERLTQNKTPLREKFQDCLEECTFVPKINPRSRKICSRQKEIKSDENQSTQSFEFQDKFMITFCKENSNNNQSFTQKSDKQAKKFPREILLLFHCLFILLDGDDDNLVSVEGINWALLEPTLSEELYPILTNADITFTQFFKEIQQEQKISTVKQILTKIDYYAKYFKKDLLDQVKNQKYTDHITIEQFVKQYQDQTHVLDQIQPVSLKYKTLIIQGLRS